MREKKVAVERGLEPVARYLEDMGLEVDTVETGDLSPSQLETYRALIIRGQKQNLLGMEDIKTQVPIIQASGRTPEEIARMIMEKPPLV